MDTMYEVLKWPVKASRLFGIAELESPALRITTRSDWTPTEETFETAGVYTKPDPCQWQENGFTNPHNMAVVHADFRNVLADRLPSDARILDLGCGNGQLLGLLKQVRPDVAIAGIDMNTKAINHATKYSGTWMHSRIEDSQWVTWKPTAVLIMPGRLLEMSAAAAELTRQRLATIPQVFLYNYSDQNADVAALAGLPDPQMLSKTPLGQIGVVERI